MSTIPTPESLKDKAKTVRKFMKEKYGVDVSHGHGLELVSQLSGFKDWNTASAAAKSQTNQNQLPVLIRTVDGIDLPGQNRSRWNVILGPRKGAANAKEEVHG